MSNMGAEHSGKRIESDGLHTSSLHFSPESSVATAYYVRDIASGKPPGKEETRMMVQAVGKDLATEGLPPGKEDYRAVMKQAEAAYARTQGIRPVSHDTPAKSESEPAINLEEYRSVMEGLFDTYGLDKSYWQTITGIYGASDLIGNVIGGYQTRPWISEESRRTLMDKVDEGLDLLHIRSAPIRDLGTTLKNTDTATKKRAAGLLLSATWPWTAGIAHYFIGRRAEKFAHKLIVSESSALQNAVNQRVAESLFMRDFEFLHDKPAGEIMEIINNGKFSTIDLIRTTYVDFLPTALSIISQLPRQYVTGKLEFISSIIKMPFLLSHAQKNARQMKANRAAELTQMDKVNTKLMTTLSGLESARTAGDAVGGAQSMLDMLTERDFVAGHGLRKKLDRDRKMDLFFDIMDVGLPLAAETWKFGFNRLRKGTVSSEVALSSGVDIFSRVINAKNQQLDLRAAFKALTGIYVDRILPDIQDIKRMEELLGAYDTLDRPNGPRERARIPVSSLPNTDIRIRDVSYNGILENVSLDIKQGSFVTIKGESGTGKTTLIRNLVGLYAPDSGAITIGGMPIDTVKKYGPEALTSVVGYANQQPQILEDMTLRENLLLWSQKPATNDTIVQTLRDLRLDHLIDRLDEKNKHFSGGEKQRIGIARALLKEPKILVLDEPTASLDEVSAQQVMAIIQDLRKTRPEMSVIAITHDPIFERISEHIIDFEKINKRSGKRTNEPERRLGDHQVLEAIAHPRK